MSRRRSSPFARRGASATLTALLLSGGALGWAQSAPVDTIEPHAEAPVADDATVPVEDVAVPDEAPFRRFGVVGLPALSLNSDEGLGYGVVGTAYWYAPGVEPYRTALTVMISTTTRRVDSHWIELDTLEPAGWPIRVRTEVGYFVTRTGTYCGTGGELTCDPAVAEAAADARAAGDPDFSDTDYETFVDRYYMRRVRRPYGFAEVRWSAFDDTPEVQLFASSRMSWALPGDNSLHAVYLDSLYDQDYPGGESGRWSYVQAGAMYDTRDYEPAPASGVWLEASTRYAGPAVASEWSFVGLNMILRGYLPLGASLVLADRMTTDLIFGDAPLQALGTVGGTDDGRQAFGGLHMGRGARLQRNPGGLKLINQTELRWRFAGLGANPRSGLTFVGFLDTAWVASTPSSDDGGALATFGGGLRVALGDFVVRADLGLSALEDFAPGYYILLRHTF